MSQVKIDRATLETIEHSLQALEDQINRSAVTVERILDAMVRHAYEVVQQHEGIVDHARDALEDCYRNDDSDGCDHLQVDYHAAERELQEIQACVRQFEREVNAFTGGHLAKQLSCNDLPRAYSALARRIAVVEHTSHLVELEMLNDVRCSDESVSASGSTEEFPRTATSTEDRGALDGDWEANLERAADDIRAISGLAPDAWSQGDIYHKAAVLREVSQALGKAYGIPSPPIIVREVEDRYVFGWYGDGYTYDCETGQIVGADYAIVMNQRANTNMQKLFGDDPVQAVHTLAHEFRHSFQAEMTSRYIKPQFRPHVPNPGIVQEWIHEYIHPGQDYDAYVNQPVERDANDFADKLVQRLYF